jgi:hypothetical protein
MAPYVSIPVPTAHDLNHTVRLLCNIDVLDFYRDSDAWTYNVDVNDAFDKDGNSFRMMAGIRVQDSDSKLDVVDFTH